MANMDTSYDNLLPRVRANISRAASKLARSSTKEQQRLLAEAMAVLNSLPPGYQAMARDMIQRESARGAGPRGLGSGGAVSTASTFANIAAILGTVATIGLSVHQVLEGRQDAKRSERQQAQQAAMERQVMEEQMAAMKEAREQRAREAELTAQAIQSGIQAPGESPAAPAGGSNKTLLIAGGVAVAAVAAMALSK